MSESNIKVTVKVRPLIRRERDNRLASQWRVTGDSIQHIEQLSEPFVFDHIFDEKATNKDVFDTIAKPIVDASMQGFNGTIFAYGQTSSGKTHTMCGDVNEPGITMLAIREIFKVIESSVDRQFLIRVSYIEIYNEKIYDLLDKTNTDLKIQEKTRGECTVSSNEFIVSSEEIIMDLLHRGNKERKTAGTKMNERSSRSHTLFRLIIESSRESEDGDPDERVVQTSYLNLVDLAGSERAVQTGATGSRLIEAGNINKSLLSLSQVIHKLSENDADTFINYRDSKLTRLLQASLGGNALTAIICTITPAANEETYSTLSFGTSAKCIKNKPIVNEVVNDAVYMKRLKREIQRLQDELAQEKCRNSSESKRQILESQIMEREAQFLKSTKLLQRTDSTTNRRRTWAPSMVPPSPLMMIRFGDGGGDSCNSVSQPPSLIPRAIVSSESFFRPVDLHFFDDDNANADNIIPGDFVNNHRGDVVERAAATPSLGTLIPTPRQLRQSYSKQLLSPRTFMADQEKDQHDFDTIEKHNPTDGIVDRRVLAIRNNDELEQLKLLTIVQKQNQEAMLTALGFTPKSKKKYMRGDNDKEDESNESTNQQQLNAAHSQIATLVHDLASAKEEFFISQKEAAEQLSDLQKELHHLQCSLKKATADKDLAEMKQTSIEFEFDAFKKRSKSREQELLGLISTPSSVPDDCKLRINALESELLMAEAKIDQLQIANAKMSSTEERETSSTASKCVDNGAIEKLTEENRRLANDLAKLQQEYDDMSLQLIDAIQECDAGKRLETVVADLRNEIEISRALSDRLKLDNIELSDRMEAQLCLMDNQISCVKDENNKLLKEIETNEETALEMENESVELKIRLEEVQSERDALTADAKKLLKDLEVANNQLYERNAALDDMESSYEQLTLKLTDLQTGNEELLANIAALSSSSNGELTEMKIRFDELQTEKESLAVKNEHLLETIAGLSDTESMCEVFKLKLANLETANQELTSKIEVFQSNMVVSNDDNSILNEKLMHYQECVTANDHLTVKVRDLESLIEQLTGKSNNMVYLESQNEELVKVISDLENKNAILNQKLINLDEIQSTNIKLSNELESVRAQLTATGEQISQLNAHIDALKLKSMHLHELELSNEKLTAMLDEQESLADLKMQHKQLTDDNALLNEKWMHLHELEVSNEQGCVIDDFTAKLEQLSALELQHKQMNDDNNLLKENLMNERESNKQLTDMLATLQKELIGHEENSLNLSQLASMQVANDQLSQKINVLKTTLESKSNECIDRESTIEVLSKKLSTLETLPVHNEILVNKISDLELMHLNEMSMLNDQHATLLGTNKIVQDRLNNLIEVLTIIWRHATNRTDDIFQPIDDLQPEKWSQMNEICSQDVLKEIDELRQRVEHLKQQEADLYIQCERIEIHHDAVIFDLRTSLTIADKQLQLIEDKYQGAVDAAETEQLRLHNEMEQLREEHAEQINRFNVERTQHSEMLSKKEEVQHRLETELEQKIVIESELNLKLRSTDEQLRLARQQLTDSERSNHFIKTQLAECEENTGHLKSMLEALGRDTQCKDLQATYELLKDQNKHLINDLIEARKVNEEMMVATENRNKLTQSQIEMHTIKFNAVTVECQRLKSELDISQKLLMEAKTGLKQMQQKLREKLMTLEETESAVAQLKVDLNAARWQIEQLKRSNDESDESLKRVEAEMQDLRKELFEKEIEVNGLKKQLDLVESEFSKKLSAEKQTNECSMNDLTESKLKIAEVQAAFAAANETNRIEVYDLKKQLNHVECEFARKLCVEKQIHESHMNDLTETKLKIDEVEAAFAAAKETIVIQRYNLESLTSDLSAANEQVKQLTADNAKLTNQSKNLSQNAIVKIEVDSKINELETQRSEVVHKHQRLAGAYNELKHRNTELMLEVDHLRARTVKERKSRRSSCHDEGRMFNNQQCIEDTHKSVQSQTIPCGCIEMAAKIKGLERDLQIRDSQIFGLQIELENNPLQLEVTNLRKLIQRKVDEYTQLNFKMIECKRAMVSDVTAAAAATSNSNAAKKCIDFGQQTEEIMENSNAPAGGSYFILEQQCTQLKADLKMYKMKYEKYRKICHMRYEEIENLKSNIDKEMINSKEVHRLKRIIDEMEEEITDYQEKYNAAVRVNEIDGSTDVLKLELQQTIAKFIDLRRTEEQLRKKYEDLKQMSILRARNIQTTAESN